MGGGGTTFLKNSLNPTVAFQFWPEECAGFEPASWPDLHRRPKPPPPCLKRGGRVAVGGESGKQTRCGAHLRIRLDVLVEHVDGVGHWGSRFILWWINTQTPPPPPSTTTTPITKMMLMMAIMLVVMMPSISAIHKITTHNKNDVIITVTNVSTCSFKRMTMHLCHHKCMHLYISLCPFAIPALHRDVSFFGAHQFPKD